MINKCKRSIDCITVKCQRNGTFKVNIFEIYLFSSVLSSVRSDFVVLKLDYALAYPCNKPCVSAVSCELIPVAVEIFDDSNWFEL